MTIYFFGLQRIKKKKAHRVLNAGQNRTHFRTCIFQNSKNFDPITSWTYPSFRVLPLPQLFSSVLPDDKCRASRSQSLPSLSDLSPVIEPREQGHERESDHPSPPLSHSSSPSFSIRPFLLSVLMNSYASARVAFLFAISRIFPDFGGDFLLGFGTFRLFLAFCFLPERSLKTTCGVCDFRRKWVGANGWCRSLSDNEPKSFPNSSLLV